MHPSWKPRNLIRAANRARNFPTNTCPPSRHAQLIAESLLRDKPYPMLDDEREHCGGSIMATVIALYKARTEIDRLRKKLGMPSLSEEALAAFDRNPVIFAEGR